jgi:biotin carboxyl carrier protein
MKYHLEINKKSFDVTISSIAANTARVLVNGQPYEVFIGSPEARGAVRRPTGLTPATVTQAPAPAQRPEASMEPILPGHESIVAPIPGLILEIKVKVGDPVVAGQTVAILEAMKMENSLTTHVSGAIKEIRFDKGSEVSTGDVVMIVG